jgi:hypothetical protein
VYLLPVASNLSGHPWRKRSTNDVACEMAKGKEHWPNVKEVFFRRRHLQHPEGSYYYIELRPLNLKWSFTSRVTTDYETLKSMKAAYPLLAMSQVTRKFQKT